jgi:crotonobetainyl-CoA:carnitine CoA-transferase CaiB-like acyl-CoA transferase
MEELAPVWAALTGNDGGPATEAVTVTGMPEGSAGPEVLPSVFRIGTAAAVAVGAATLAAAVFGAERVGGPGAQPPPVDVDLREAALSFRSERYLRVDGQPAPRGEPLTGDYPTSDGWIRLHCDFPHHAEAACLALGVPAGRAEVARALLDRLAVDAEQAVIDVGGAAGALRSPREWADHAQSVAIAARPVVDVRRVASGDTPRPRSAGARSGRRARPLAGLRVLDLTRVIAGPVAGRVLTAWGADVLAIRCPHLPTVAWLDVDTGFGKRLRLLDLRDGDDRSAFLDLVRGADVVLQSYRPGALDRLGFSPADLAAVRPGLGHVSVSAYGDAGPWAGRRGFDSLVQLVTGLADVGRLAAGVDRPVPLPAQALDHAAGWLAAAAVIETARRARSRGGSWRADVTLAGVAHWLDGLGRVDAATAAATPDPGPEDVADRSSTMRVPGGDVRYVLPPGRIDGTAPSWESPSPFPLPPA